WLLVAIAVIAGSAAFGRELDDDTSVPGLDSQVALDLLAGAGSDLLDQRVGVTAQVVLAPVDPDASLTDDALVGEVGSVRAALADLPNVLAVSDPFATGGVSPDGRVALVRVQYPELAVLEAADLDRLQAAVDSARGEQLQVEAGG